MVLAAETSTPVNFPANIASFAIRVCHNQGVDIITASIELSSKRFL